MLAATASAAPGAGRGGSSSHVGIQPAERGRSPRVCCLGQRALSGCTWAANASRARAHPVGVAGGNAQVACCLAGQRLTKPPVHRLVVWLVLQRAAACACVVVGVW